MSQVRIQTVHNVSIDFEIASLGERLWATIIDILIQAGYVIVVVMLMNAAGIFDYRYGNSPAVLVSLFIVLPILLYHPVCEYFLNGQSFGKKAMRTKVVRVDGGEPSIGGFLLRWLIGLMEINVFSGVPAILAIAIGGKGQRLGDMAADTMVVRLKRLGDFNETVYMDYNDDYKPVYGSEVLRLSDKDMGTLKSIINVVENSRSMPPNIGEILQKAKENVEGVIQVNSNQEPLAFLRQVVKDYNHHSNQN